MRWEEASKVIKEAWDEKLELDEGSYYKSFVKGVFGRKTTIWRYLPLERSG